MQINSHVQAVVEDRPGLPFYFSNSFQPGFPCFLYFSMASFQKSIIPLSAGRLMPVPYQSMGFDALKISLTSNVLLDNS